MNIQLESEKCIGIYKDFVSVNKCIIISILKKTDSFIIDTLSI